MTLDGCFVPGQSPVARALLLLDRGRFVREQKAYLSIMAQHFDVVSSVIRHDLLSFPYTLLIMSCRRKSMSER